MSKKGNESPRGEKDPPWVHTSHDGRKFIRSNEFVQLDRFKEQIRKFREITKPGSKLVKD